MTEQPYRYCSVSFKKVYFKTTVVKFTIVGDNPYLFSFDGYKVWATYAD